MPTEGALIANSNGTLRCRATDPYPLLCWGAEDEGGVSSLMLYVAATGSDSNDGLTPGTPFRTLSKALTVLGTLDPGSLFSCPGWVAYRTYQGGDKVFHSGYNWVCLIAGTVGFEPGVESGPEYHWETTDPPTVIPVRIEISAGEYTVTTPMVWNMVFSIPYRSFISTLTIVGAGRGTTPGAWSAGTTYDYGDGASYGGKTWRSCIDGNTGITPGETSDWEEFSVQSTEFDFSSLPDVPNEPILEDPSKYGRSVFMTANRHTYIKNMKFIGLLGMKFGRYSEPGDPIYS